MIKKLLEQLLSVKTESISEEMDALKAIGGWIKPDGTTEVIEFQFHQEDAARKMKKFTGKYYPNSHKTYLDLMKLKRYIAVDEEYPKGVDISIGAKVTNAQLHTIRKLAKDNDEFYYSIYIKPGKVEHGTKFNEFVSALKTYNLLESIIVNEKRKLHKGLEHCPWCGLYTDECRKCYEQIGERCCKKCAAYMRGEEVRESSIDFPQKDLDLDVWDKEDNTYTIKPEVKRKILDFINKYPDMDLIDTAAAGISDAATIHVVGSIATNQYLDDSDIDVHIEVSKDADFHGDEVFQRKVGTWFNEHRDEIDGYIEKHPIEIYLQYNPAQDLMSDGVYDLLADKWIIRPKIAPSNYDPYQDFSSIADDIRNAVQNADVLLGELKRDVIDYDVIKQAVERMSGEDKEHFLKNLQDKLIEIEDDIRTLYSKRKEWVDMRHFASKPETPEQAMRDVELAKKWRDTNALFKFINRYKYLKVIGDLTKLLADDKISSWEIDTIKSVVGAK